MSIFSVALEPNQNVVADWLCLKMEYDQSELLGGSLQVLNLLFATFDRVHPVLLSPKSSLATTMRRSPLNDSRRLLSLSVRLCPFACLLANWSTSALSICQAQEKKKKKKKGTHLAPYLSCSSNLLWAVWVETEELSLSRGCEPATFSISPHAHQSPSARTISRNGQRCHLLFISSLIRKKEDVLYIVMLPHLSDIHKIEVQAKDQYKLKVNTKKSQERSGAAFPGATSSFCSFS